MTSPLGPQQTPLEAGPPTPPGPRAPRVAQPGYPARDEFEAVLDTRRERGAAMEPALVDSFATRIVHEIARQEHLRAQRIPKPPSTGPALALGIISVVMLVPLSAIALTSPYPWALLVIAPALAVINIAFAWGQRRRQSDD